MSGYRQGRRKPGEPRVEPRPTRDLLATAKHARCRGCGESFVRATGDRGKLCPDCEEQRTPDGEELDVVDLMNRAEQRARGIPKRARLRDPLTDTRTWDDEEGAA